VNVLFGRTPAGSLWLAVCLFIAVPARADGRSVNVPLRFDFEFIRQALLSQVYTGPDAIAVLWDDGTGCGFLRLHDPAVSSVGNRLRVASRGEARVGTRVGKTCLAPVQWEGFVEVFEQPSLDADQRLLMFRVVDSNIYDKEWKKRLFTGKIWDLVKRYVQPRFEAVRIDLNAPLQDLRELLPLIVARGDTERIERVLDSLHVADAGVTDTGVTLSMGFAISAVTPVMGPTPEPTLTADELRRWEEAWQHWDAFLTFVVKQVGRDTSTQELHQALTEVLLEARYDILEALAPSAPGAPDPTRALFLKTWGRLAPVVRRSAAPLPGSTALRYLSFIAAGDALAALDQMGPDIGLDISADGLRRLARIVAPASAEDPLAYSTAVDPELRQLFGFGAPLPPPDLSGAPDDQAWWRRFFGPHAALAAGEAPSSKSLARWIAERDTIDVYLQAVRQVLDDVTAQTLGGAHLQERYREMYRRLVLAAAWQESCWRQFRRSRDTITYIKSAVGSTGMMQVNEHVWRGAYDLRGLRWDIHYNGRAGAEILMHYLEDYAVARGEDKQPGGTDNLARATYAVYNGGPGHLARYRKKTTSKSLRRIDDLFWQKYRAVSAGREGGVRECIVGG
jgi:Transglycosylase SLT domain